MTLQQVTDFYKAGMDKNGWTLQSTTTGNNMVALVFNKGGNRTFMLSVVTLPNKAVEQVQLVVQ
jgi:hypothetical protein